MIQCIVIVVIIFYNIYNWVSYRIFVSEGETLNHACKAHCSWGCWNMLPRKVWLFERVAYDGFWGTERNVKVNVLLKLELSPTVEILSIIIIIIMYNIFYTYRYVINVK